MSRRPARVLVAVIGAILLAGPAAAFSRRTVDRLVQVLMEHEALTASRAGYDVVFRRDPLQAMVDAQGRLETSVGFHGGLSAQGIIWSSERPFVVVDDALFGAGETVGPYTIEAIHEDGITVRRDDARVWIPLDRGIDTPPSRQLDPAMEDR